MKKILLASTALVASAGFAAADVTVGGDGYFGVAFGQFDGDGIFNTTANPSTTDADGNFVQAAEDRSDYAFVYDLDFDFTGSGETDSGLVFGASADADEVATSQGALGFDSTIFVSGAFGTLSMGDTDGGAEAIIGDLSGVGITGLGDFNENIFLLGAGAPPAGALALYEYNFAGASFALGLSDDEGFSLGAGYAGEFANGGWNVGIAYESVQEGAEVTLFDIDALGGTGTAGEVSTTSDDDVEHIIGTAGVNFAGFGLKAVYGQADAGSVDADQYGLSADYGFDAVSLSAYYRRVETDGLADDFETDFFGVGASYDLGGGLALGGGIASAQDDNFAGDLVVADFGLTFDF